MSRRHVAGPSKPTCKCFNTDHGKFLLAVKTFFADVDKFVYDRNNSRNQVMDSLLTMEKAIDEYDNNRCQFTLDDVDCYKTADHNFRAYVKGHASMQAWGSDRERAIANLAIVLSENAYRFDFGD